MICREGIGYWDLINRIMQNQGLNFSPLPTFNMTQLYELRLMKQDFDLLTTDQKGALPAFQFSCANPPT